MSEREYPVRVTRTFRASPERVWALIADTNRWDRVAGVAPGSYSYRAGANGERERVGVGRQLGFALEWVEPPYEWVEGVFVEGVRRYARGPVAEGGLRAVVRPVADGRTELEATAFLRGSSPLLPAVAAILGRRFRRALHAYLAAMETLLAFATRDPEGDPDNDTVASAHRALLAATDPDLGGPATPADAAGFAHRAAALGDDRLDPAVRARFVAWLAAAPDEAVEAMRPYELARVWGAARDAVLRVFLHGTRAGLVDLAWRIHCPVCRVGAASAGALADVGRGVHCDACGVDYEVDFAAHVEAVFRPNAAVRAVEPRVYCASSASFRTHVVAAVALAPGAARSFRVRLPREALFTRVAGLAARAHLPEGPAPARLAITADGAALTIATEGTTEGTATEGWTELVLANRGAAPVFVQVERTRASPDAVPGTAMLTFPDYLDLFATEAPARGVDLKVGSLAILFSDLTGSTALYERVGDARAFAIVEKHFRVMGEVVVRHGGSVVKTMGDAVLATFPRATEALRAGLAMIRATAAEHGAEGLALKVGVHAGPCLAVRANDRLDFFGTTVNLAARLEAQARGGEAVVMEATLAHPDMAALTAGLPRRCFDAPLKGIREVQRLVALTATEPAGLTATEPLDDPPSAD